MRQRELLLYCNVKILINKRKLNDFVTFSQFLSLTHTLYDEILICKWYAKPISRRKRRGRKKKKNTTTITTKTMSALENRWIDEREVDENEKSILANAFFRESHWHFIVSYSHFIFVIAVAKSYCTKNLFKVYVICHWYTFSHHLHVLNLCLCTHYTLQTPKKNWNNFFFVFNILTEGECILRYSCCCCCFCTKCECECDDSCDANQLNQI